MPGCPKEDEVIGETGVPQYHTVPKEQGETSTILTFANAARLVVPPLIIHKGDKVSDTWCINCPVGVMAQASPKGWINQDIFIEYMVRWIRFMKTHGLLEKWHLLLLDAHRSHVYNIRFIKICKQLQQVTSSSHWTVCPLQTLKQPGMRNSLITYFTVLDWDFQK